MIYKKLKEMLKNALEDVTEKGELTSSNLETISKLICSIKDVDQIQNMERNTSENNSFDSRPSRMYNYDYGYGYDYDSQDMMRSEARRRDGRGRYTNDHQSEINEIISEMHELKNRIKDPEIKHKVEKMIMDFKA